MSAQDLGPRERLWTGPLWARFAGCIAVGLVVGLILGTAVGKASGEQPQAGILVEGHVYSTVPGEGRVADGASVSVSWTSPLSGATAGSVSRVTPLSSTTVASDGSYALRVEPSNDMRAAARLNGGWLNFDLVVVDASSRKLLTATVSRQLAEHGWVTPQVNRAALRTLRARTDAQRGIARREPGGAEDPVVSPARAPELDLVVSPTSRDSSSTDVQMTAPGRPAGRGQPQMTCYWVTDATPARWDSILEFHNASNSNASYSYGKTAGSDIEAAANFGGGGWGVIGTYSISNTRGSKITYATSARDNSFARSQFEWRDQHADFPGHANGYGCPYQPGVSVGDHKKSPIEWVGGVQMNTTLPGAEFIGCSSSPQKDHRTSYPVGAGYTRDTNSAAKIGNAVDLGPITVGSNTDYSTSMSQSWTASRGSGIFLCGTNYYPPTAGVIHAENR
jgi:hypothetical protein